MQMSTEYATRTKRTNTQTHIEPLFVHFVNWKLVCVWRFIYLSVVVDSKQTSFKLTMHGKNEFILSASFIVPYITSATILKHCQTLTMREIREIIA